MPDLWYYTSEGKQMEPVTGAELRQLASSGFLKPTDLVWKEGMASWVKASTISGMFANAAPAKASRPATASAGEARPVDRSAVQASPAPRSRAAVPEDDEDEPPRRRRRREEDEDDDDERPRRRRRAAAKSGSGLIIGLIIGGACVVLLILGLTLFFVFRGGGVAAPKGNFAAFSVDLGPGVFNVRDVTLKAGTRYEFTVKSDRRTDVDLFLENGNGQIMLADQSIGPNSYLQFIPPAAGNYRVKVVNLDMSRTNRSHVAINDLGAGGVAAAPPPGPAFGRPRLQPIGNPGGANPIAKAAGPMTTVQMPLLNPGGSWDTTVMFPVAKQVHVTVTTVQPTVDVDLFIEAVGGGPITADVRISPNCSVNFFAQAGQSYRFRVENLGPVDAQSTLMHTSP